ncbi:MAG: cellulase family glycosylhydrolase [Deltaproteobacteria bacterium]|nr:MAG: cellulase family glycosylhydrolase [Deltaproteobacteria bacterium]
MKKKRNILFQLLIAALTCLLGIAAAGCEDGRKETRSIKAAYADGKWIKDDSGRILILRGINAGGDSKIPPFLPFEDVRCVEQIEGWGMNVVRYLVTWEGVEPNEGEYSREYLDRVETIVNWFTERGIHVFIDMHQDLFTRKFCGDGAPEWAAVSDPAELPFECGQDWVGNYMSQSVIQSFDRFWTDTELQDHFIKALTMLAERFCDNDLVIGYDIFNEPWHGSFDYSSGDFEVNYLMPFYRRAINALREKDPEAIIFIEPAIFASGLLLTQSKLPALDFPNAVYSPHYYSLGAITGSEPDIDSAIEEIDEDLVLVLAKAGELGTPAILGEYGSHPDQPGGLRLIQGYYEKLDKYMLGGTIWTYALRDLEWNNEGMSVISPDLSEREFLPAIERPYPMAISGEPEEFYFDYDTGEFYLRFASFGLSEPTLIYTAKSRHYPSGLNIEISGGIYELRDDGHIIEYYSQSEGSHYLKITP